MENDCLFFLCVSYFDFSKANDRLIVFRSYRLTGSDKGDNKPSPWWRYRRRRPLLSDVAAEEKARALATAEVVAAKTPPTSRRVYYVIVIASNKRLFNG